MLARLDEVEGVTASRVDWSGRYVLLELEPEADASRAVRKATAVLGQPVRRLPARDEASQVEAFRKGEPWMRAGESSRMSRRESEVLSGRITEQVARDAGLDEAETGRLGALLREELAGAFERAHEAGGDVERLHDQLAVALEGLPSKLSSFLSPPKAERVLKVLQDRYGD